MPPPGPLLDIRDDEKLHIGIRTNHGSDIPAVEDRTPARTPGQLVDRSLSYESLWVRAEAVAVIVR